MCIPYDSAIPFLGMYSNKINTQRNMYKDHLYSDVDNSEKL